MAYVFEISWKQVYRNNSQVRQPCWIVPAFNFPSWCARAVHWYLQSQINLIKLSSTLKNVCQAFCKFPILSSFWRYRTTCYPFIPPRTLYGLFKCEDGLWMNINKTIFIQIILPNSLQFYLCSLCRNLSYPASVNNFVYEYFLCFFQFSQWCASTPSLTSMTALNSANGTCLRWTMKAKVTRGKLKQGNTPWIILVWTETLPALVRENPCWVSEIGVFHMLICCI